MATASWTSACILLIAMGSAAATFHSVPTPALLWANNKLFGERAASVNYQTLDLLDTWNALRESGTKGSEITSGSEKPSTVILFAGHQLRPQDLGSLKSEPVMQPLQEALADSESSLLLPNLESSGKLGAFMESIAELESSNVKVVGACTGGSDNVDVEASVRKILSKKASDDEGTEVVIICSSDSLETEMANLKKVTSVLDGHAEGYAIMYVSYDPSRSEKVEPLKSQKRRLLETEDWVINYEECDELCMTQVKFLEGIILALVLTFALAAGLSCTHILDGPSQFETAEHES